MEALRLRVKDVDAAMKQITVRSGKGDKDRVTTFAGAMIPLVQNAKGSTHTLVSFLV